MQRQKYTERGVSQETLYWKVLTCPCT